ncbi:MAG: homocysteine S-methyltransferase family protein [Pirellulaceae bacterium]
MSPLIEELLRHGPVVTDGAWGTQLQQLGLSSGDCPDAWNLTHASQVEKVPRAYVEAGSRIVLTNTFRANRLALASYGRAERCRNQSQRGRDLAAGGWRAGIGVCLNRTERQDAFDRRGQSRRAATGI